MTPAVRRFLDLATKPLAARSADRDQAKGELMARLNHGGVAADQVDLSRPLERLEANEENKAKRGRLVLNCGVLLFFALLVIGVGREVLQLVKIEQAGKLGWQGRYSDDQRVDISLLMNSVRSEAPDLPLGLDSESYTSALEEAEALVRLHPDDLALRHELNVRRFGYAWNKDRVMSEAELEELQGLDPGNGLWPLLRMEEQVKKALTTPKDSKSGNQGPVMDEEAWAEAGRLLALTTEAPRFKGYHRELQRRQLDAFPIAELLGDALIQKEFGEIPSVYRFAVWENYFDIELKRARASRDRERVLQLSRQWSKLTAALDNENAKHGVVPSVHHNYLQLETLTDLNYEAEADQLKRVIAMQRMALDKFYLSDFELRKRSGVMLRNSWFGNLPYTLDLFSYDELVPTRMAEYAWADRLAAAAAALVFLVLLTMVAFEIHRRPKQVKGLAQGLMPLLDWRDQCWMGGLGLLLPCLWWWGVIRLTQFGMRDFSILTWDAIPWLLQNVLGLTLVVLMLLLTVQWRWGKRGEFLGMGRRHKWLGWAMAGLAALAIPAVGGLRFLKYSSDGEHLYLLGVAAGGSFGLLWLLWQVTMGLLVPRAGALRASLSCRTLRPWLMAAGVLMLACLPALRAVERYWFGQDTLLGNWTSESYPNALEGRVAAELHRQIEEVSP